VEKRVDWTGAVPARDGAAVNARAALAAAYVRLAHRLAAEGHRVGLWLVTALGAGIAIYFALPSEPPLWAPASALAAAFAAWMLARMQQSARLAFLALFVAAIALGCTVGRVRTLAVGAPVLAERIGAASLDGRIVSIEPAPERQGRPLGPRVVLDRLAIAGLSTVPDRVRLRLRPNHGAVLKPGDRIALRASLTPPSPPAAPGSYDFARQAYFQGIGAVGFALGSARIVASGSARRAGILDAARLWLQRLHTRLDERIRAILPSPSGPMASALLTGEHGAIPPGVNDDMRDSGLAHLLAISGMNLSLVIGFLFVGSRALLAGVPWIALRCPIKKWAVAPALLGGLFYLLVTDANVPTQRAFVMATFVLLAVALDRTAISLRLVALAGAVVLLTAPESLLGPSFQMSFAAVIGLIAAYDALGARFARWKADGGVLRWVAFYLGSVFGATLIAGLATTPLAIYHFNRFAILSVPANMLAEPLTSLWIMPWGTLAYLLMPFGIEALALIPMGWGLDALAWIAHAIARLPGAAGVVPAMPTWGLVAAALGGLWIAFWSGRWRWWGLAGVALSFLSIAVERPPDVLVGEGGALIGVRAADGHFAVMGSGRRGFVAESWARRLGEEIAAETAIEGMNCRGADCLLRVNGTAVALPHTYPALFHACDYRGVDAVVTPLYLGRTRCRVAVVIGRDDLRGRGVHALWLDADGVRVLSVRDGQGDRPWSVGMGTVRRVWPNRVQK
jgi:competence protein ComEC